MSSVYLCASSVCCCLVLTALLRILAPGGSTSKVMSMVLGVFVLCTVASTVRLVFKSSDFRFKGEELTSKEEGFYFDYEKEVLKTTADYLNSYLNALLESKDIYKSIIRTTLDISDDKGIYIKELSIYLDKKYTKSKGDVTELIRNSTGVTPEIREIKYE